MTLNSSNPFDPPLIDPNLLGSDFDMFTMREAVKTAQRFLTAPAWNDYILQPFGGLANITSDADLDEYIRNNTATIFHPVGTAAFSPRNAQYGVVDPDLLLKGAVGVRVVDVSVLVRPSKLHVSFPNDQFTVSKANSTCSTHTGASLYRRRACIRFNQRSLGS